MRVLILGSSGPVGRSVIVGLNRLGVETVGLSRTGGGDGAARRVRADRGDAAALRAVLDEVRPQTVVDLIALTPASSLPVLAAASEAGARYVLVSSGDVYRNYGLLRRRPEEGRAPPDARLTEGSPLRSGRHPYRGPTPRPQGGPDRWMDDYDKIPIEAACMRLATEWTILRLPMLFGPGDPQRRFAWALTPMIQGAPRLAAPAAWLAWTTTYGFLANIGAAIAAAAVDPRAARRVFNLVDFEPRPHREWVRRFAAIAGWSGAIEAAGTGGPLAETAASLDLAVPLAMSGASFAAALGFIPPVDLETALAETLADERRRGAGSGV